MDFKRIKKIEEIEYKGELFNLHIEDNHNYFANNLLVKNCHTMKAKSLKSMIEKCVNTKIKIGVTGTFPDNKLSQMTIQGLFGPTHKFISSRELMDQGYSTPINIKILSLNHSDSVYWNRNSKLEYIDEIAHIISSEKRLEFIKNLGLSLKGNTFIMFREIDYGKAIFNLVSETASVPVFYVDGLASKEEREEIIAKVETLENSITICSVVFNTGINVKKIDNIIFTRPSKSRIQVFQAIGRGLRKSPGKKVITLFDIADKIHNDINNITYDHKIIRERMYKQEEFPFKNYYINL